jgi:very-short-patch-repair endonuclease
MKISKKLILELQNRLKVGNRRGVHLNAIPANSRYKFDFSRLAQIDEKLPQNFIKSLLKEQPLKFKISWKDNVPDLNLLMEEEQSQLVRITKSFENLINQTEAIESEKGINTFGFGFPILIRRDNTDNKITVAPILIWSLRIKRTKEFNTWEIIRNEEDPIYLNEVLVNHLKSDSNIELQPTLTQTLEDGLITKEELVDFCVKLLGEINTVNSENLHDVLTKKIDNITPIGDKAKYDKLPLNSTNSLIEFGGLFSIFEVQKQNIIDDYESLLTNDQIEIDDLDGFYSSFQPISSIETDPSQQGILNSIQNNRNLLIQGPPGTGKSQTLTALLINALENNKRTIVVCEKRTALEVLHEQLIEKGLSRHCILIRDIVKDRKPVVDSVRERVDNYSFGIRSNIRSQSEQIKFIEKIKTKINEINSQHKLIDKSLIGSKNWTTIVGEYISSIKNSIDYNEVKFKGVEFSFTENEFDFLLETIQNGESLFLKYEKISDLTFLNPDKLLGDNPFKVEQQIHEDFEAYRILKDQIHVTLDEVESDFIDIRKNKFKNQLDGILKYKKQFSEIETLINDSIRSQEEYYMEGRINEFNNEIDRIEKILLEIDNIVANYPDLHVVLDQESTSSLSFQFTSIFSSSKRKLKKDQSELKKAFSKLHGVILKSRYLSSSQIHQNFFDAYKQKKIIVDQIHKIKTDIFDQINVEFASFSFHRVYTENGSVFISKKRKEISLDNNLSENSKSILYRLADQLSSIIDLNNKSFEKFVNEIQSYRDFKIEFNIKETLAENVITYRELLQEVLKISEQFLQNIKGEINELNLLVENEYDNQISSIQNLRDKIHCLDQKIKSDNWVKSNSRYTTHKEFIRHVTELLISKDAYFKNGHENFSSEFDWFRYYNALDDKTKKVIDYLKDISFWKDSFLVSYLNTLLTNSADYALPKNDENIKQLREIFDGFNSHQIGFIDYNWQNKQLKATKAFEQSDKNSLSVSNLYLKKQGTRNKRLSLRQIVKYDPMLFSTYFPIVLTSPDVASNLFKGMNDFFDIVMFDEASQLKLEDNLPALLKGKQVIIAGDEHQMPPSNYFSKVFDGVIEDEEEDTEDEDISIDKNDVLLSCESLLDFASELNFEKRFLDFHYRSRHPYLIDFSNHAFYNKRLKPLPNNFSYRPIKYVQVEGTFHDHTNNIEADMVISIIEHNINRLPNGNYPTVGIATFNIAQRNLIKSKILERQKFDKYSEFNNKIQELEENGLFVKNLENIQGDERDVIILSTTYGISKDGKFHQRFGPINHSKGYKLLNVIITRAKYKIYVCSSIPESVFMKYNEYLGAEGNNKRAVFFAYLAYAKYVSEGNLDGMNYVLNCLSLNTPTSVNLDSGIGENLESPFEEEVYQSLVEHFDNSCIIPQLKIGGFRIDLVYDCGLPNVPKIAIECDGAKYHSSKEAYLYDIHRQKIIESQGFVFHRIWSTNWWRDYKKEEDKLVKFIRSTIDSFNAENQNNLDLTADAFNDEIVSFSQFSNIKSVDEYYESENEHLEQFQEEDDDDKAIKIGSIVKLNYINNDKVVTILISDNQLAKNEVVNGIQKINSKSPLALSLNKKHKGEIVKIGNLDNYVEILDVQN